MSTRLRQVKVCVRCGNNYRPWRADASFCSRKCKDLHSRRGKFLRCETCGQKFWHMPSTGVGRFCSIACVDLTKLIDQRKWSLSKYGYLWMGHIKHPMSNASGSLLQHWYVLYEASRNKQLILELRKMRATVHHRNGKRDDNEPSNLEIRLRGGHPNGVGITEAKLLLRAQGYTVA